ncbi:Dual 3' [Phytophthora citrophthora]|uniref:Dual 3 n=1 Tax=Phytophthora citrophthora TaxID=4793 RepID=A0AAD9LCZ3_9STRA|nr:Dual 3' [Phytophthora citrophthora]
MEATKIIIKQACAVLNAERSTLFIYERATDMLVLKVSEGATDIRVPYGKGIAGTVAATGKAMNISDAYADPNFDSQYDQRNGYQTRSMLCVPVCNGANNTVGVMQVLNKISLDKKASFSDEDEEILTILAAQAGVALHNADTHTVACIARERVKDVLSIVQDMHRDLGFISLMFTISTRVQRFVNSDRCTLYIVDRAKNELWTLQGEVNIRVPLNQGIAGAVVIENEAINLANAYDDPRFNKDFDQKLGYQTRSVLAMPLRNGSGEIIAVVQLINKLDSSGVFSADDEDLLSTFLQIAGPILFNSHSHLTISSSQAKDDIGTEFTGKSTRGAQEIVEMNVISENDEEEG